MLVSNRTCSPARDSFRGTASGLTITIASVAAHVVSDDEELLSEISFVLRDTPSTPRTEFSFHVSLEPGASHGTVTIECADPIAYTVDDLLLSASAGSPEFPFRLIEPESTGWTAFAWRADSSALFEFRDNICRFWLRDGWRSAIALLLLHCVYRVRRDALFFHAATVNVGGRGAMIIGPKGAGKSTTSLSLAVRGHALLGDETGAYVPATGLIEPFLRPVGIKPGPRARGVDEALLRISASEEPARIIRVPFDSLIDAPAPEPVPLRAIFFLRPFEERPRITETAASITALSELQTVSSCFVNAPRTQRVFELGRMLGRCRLYHLAPGNPDETAECLEQRIGALAS